MPLHTWTLFAAAYLATTISPGPNVLLVIRNTVRYGRKGTAPTIAGNLIAQLAVVMLAALSVGAVLTALPAVFIGMKVAGAAYLIYLGIKQIGRKKARTERLDPAAPDGTFDRWQVFREALLISGSNPKTLIFLSAFMPQFVAHDRPLVVQFIVMYATIACIVAVVHTVYSAGIRGMHNRLRASRWMEAVKRSGGVIFVVLGVKLLTSKPS